MICLRVISNFRGFFSPGRWIVKTIFVLGTPFNNSLTREFVALETSIVSIAKIRSPGFRPAKSAVHTLSELVEVSLVTLGKEGALIGSHGQFYSVPAEGGKPVDTTGAGDNFAAGFLYGQSIGASLVQSARIGSMLAGYVIDVVGPEIPYDKWEQIKLKVKGILA